MNIEHEQKKRDERIIGLQNSIRIRKKLSRKESIVLRSNRRLLKRRPMRTGIKERLEQGQISRCRNCGVNF